MASPVVLGFPEYKTRDVRARVIGENGDLVATLSPATRKYRFDAEDADGSDLCTGRMRSMMGWQALDADGTPLVDMGAGFFGRYTVRFRGGEISAVLRGRAYRGDLAITIGKDQFLLNSIPPHGSWAFGASDWIVRSDGTLTVPEIVAVVELHRLEMRRRRKPSPRRRLKRRRPGPRPA